MRLTRTARVVLIGSAIGVTSTCSHFHVGGVVGAHEVLPSAAPRAGGRLDLPDASVPPAQRERGAAAETNR